jgi:hypothetical protein
MKNLTLLTLILLLLTACAGTLPASDVVEFPAQTAMAATTMAASSTFFSTITPSPTPTPSPIPLPTNTYTASPEPAIAPNCNLTNEAGQLYLLSDLEFHSIFTTAGKLDRALAVHYPEWASYRQMVSWSTEPETLGEIINSASLDTYLNLQINSGVILVTLGETLDWQLPSNTDLSLKATEISTALNRPDLDWDNPYNESLRSQYPQVANGGTYALYAYFNYDPDKLQSWCNVYQQMFGTP